MGSSPVTIDNYLNKGCNSLLLVNLRETGMTAANTVVDTFSGPGECSILRERLGCGNRTLQLGTKKHPHCKCKSKLALEPEVWVVFEFSASFTPNVKGAIYDIQPMYRTNGVLRSTVESDIIMPLCVSISCFLFTDRISCIIMIMHVNLSLPPCLWIHSLPPAPDTVSVKNK